MADKRRLVDTILHPGSGAVVSLDDVYGEAFASAARISGLDLQTVGAAGGRIRILDVARDGWAQIATVDIGDGVIRYGAFINAVISFVFIAFGVFLVVKAVNRLRREKDEEPAGPSEAELLTQIRDLLQEQRQG